MIDSGEDLSRNRISNFQKLILGSPLTGTRPEFLDFPENREGKEQVVFSGEGRRDPKTTCSFPYRFSGKSRNSGRLPGKRDPKINSWKHFFGSALIVVPTVIILAQWQLQRFSLQLEVSVLEMGLQKVSLRNPCARNWLTSPKTAAK